MRKIFIAFGIVFLSCIVPYSIASAGSINSYEQEVISYAQGTFEYNGVLYKVDPYYIKLLREYFAADDVELTAEQRDKVFKLAESYIETGVLGGYLVPVGNKEAPVDADTGSNGGNNSGSTGNSDSTENSDSADNADSNGNISEADDLGDNAEDDTKSVTDKSENNAGDGNNDIRDKFSETLDSLDSDDKDTAEYASQLSQGSNGTGSNNPSNGNNESVVKEDTPEGNKSTYQEPDKKEAGMGEDDNAADAINADKAALSDGFLELLDLMLAVDKDIETEQAIEEKQDNDKAKEIGIKTEITGKIVDSTKNDIAVSDNVVIINDIINKDINLNNTFIVLIILGLLLLMCIIMTIKLTYMGKKYEN